jgi:hypothetical protein
MASEDTGGTKGATVESIRLELETNFEKILKSEVYNFQRFVIKTGVISRNVSNSFNQLGQSVAKSMRHMTKSALEGITNSFDKNINLMKSVSSQGIKVNELYIETFRRLEDNQEEYREEIEKTAQALSKLKEAAKHYKGDKFGDAQGKANEELREKQILELSQKAEELKQHLDKENQKIFDQFNRRLGRMAQEATGAYVQTTETALESVRSSVRGLNNELSKVKSTFGLQDDASKLFNYQAHFDKVKKQHANLQDALRQQSRLTAEAEKKVQLAQFAFNNAISKQTKTTTYEALKKTAQDQNIVKKGYIELEQEVRKFGTTVRSVQGEIDVLSQKMKKSISGESKLTSQGIFRNIEKSMDLLVQRAQDTGRGMHEAIASNIEKSTKVTGALDLQVKKLKELREQALILQKTGFVDERNQIRKIDAVLKKYEQFVAQYKKEQSIIQNTLGKKSVLQASFNFAGIKKFRDEYNALSREIENNGAITSKNMFEAQDNVKKLESLWNAYVKKRIELNNRIKALIEEQNRVEQEKATVTNAKLRSLLDAHINKIKSKVSGLKAELNTIYETPKFNRYFNQIKEAASKAQNEIKRNFIDNNKYVEKGFKDIAKQYDILIDKAIKLSQKRFVKQSVIDETKKGFKDLKTQAEEYIKTLLHVQNSIRELQQIQRRGLGGPGIQSQIKTLQGYAAAMKSHIQGLNVYATQAQRNQEKLHAKNLKTYLSSSWEMIRNFRWQVAAVIYLVSRAVMAVQRTVLAVFNNIQKFRTDAMSIAASVSMQMVGDIKTNFEQAYNFARDLMLKLEMTAAKTILTLEDMLMLTKTFAQAGFIPETDKDVQNIATIGTAIKALTEGMANAGVQMRQELYAIIAGRQRATDQLAMMFKMVGVDIQKVIKDAKEEGIEMAEALATALKPFDEMNRRMETEYSAVVNRLKVIWGYLQRIGAESTLLDTAKQLMKLADALAYISKETDKLTLTQLGKEVAMSISMAMETIKATVMAVVDMIEFLFTTFSLAGDMFLKLFGGASEEAENLSGVMKSIAITFEGIIKALAVFRTVLQIGTTMVLMMRTVFEGISELVINIGKILLGVLTASPTLLKQGITGLGKAVLDLYKNGKEVVGSISQIPEIWKEADQAIQNAYDTLKNKDKEQTELNLFKLPYSMESLSVDMDKLTTKFNKFKEESLSGIEKIQFEFELDTEGFEEVKKRLTETIAYIQEKLDTLQSLGVGVGPRDPLRLRLRGFVEALHMLEKVSEAAAAKRDKAIKDLQDKERKALAESKKQWESYLIEIANKPETRKEKTDKWYQLQIEKINELKETNVHAAQEIQRAWDALAEGYHDRLSQDVKDTKKEYDDFVNKIRSYETVTAVERIGNEFKDIYDSINESVDLNDIQKFQLVELAYLAKERRLELEKTTRLQRMTMQQLELEGKKAAFMQKDFMPDYEKRRGRILELRNNYVKSMTDIEHKIQDLHDKYQEAPGIWRRNTQEFQLHASILKQELQMLKEAFKFDDFVVNLPFDIKEMESDFDQLKDKTRQFTRDSLTGPAKFRYEASEDLRENDEKRKKFQKQLEDAERRFSDATTNPNFYPPEQRKKIQDLIDYYKNALKETDAADVAAKAKLSANLKKWQEEQKDMLANQKKTWETFLLEIADRPQTRNEKTETWLKETQLALENYIEKYNLSAEEAQRGQELLAEGFNRRMRQNAEATQKEIDDLINTISSHEVLSAIEKIDLEFNKVQQTLRENINISDAEKLKLAEKIEKIRQERIEVEKVNQAYRNRAKYLDVQSAKASFMQGSFSPLERQKGDLLALKAQYAKSMMDIRKEMDKTIDESWNKLKGMWETQEAADYFRLLQAEARETSRVFEREFFRKQYPLWTQLNEMSQNWADGLSDSLADLVLDFDNFAESIKSLWESILRDTLKASIKQGLINPLMSSLGTGEPGSPTLYQRMFGKKDEEKANAPAASNVASAVQKLQEMMGFGKEGQMSIMDTFLASGTPIPVVVVDGATQIAGIQEVLNRTNESVNKTGADTKGAINNTSTQSKSLFQQMLTALFGIKAAIIGSGTSNAAGSATGSTGGIFGMIAGLFGGGGGTAAGTAVGSSTALGGGSFMGAGGTAFGGIGMAEGGTISEHIVGRGLKSGRIYEFGEKTKYGEFEDVIPRKKMPIHGSGQSVTMSMPININAIDTQTGVDFIMKNQKVIENGMLRSMKNNKALRGMIRQSW